jgi:hypothetical protein
MQLYARSLLVSFIISSLFILHPLAAVAASTTTASEKLKGSPRQQINTISAYLDGSVIYGSDTARAKALRTFVGGRLKTSGNNLLPLNTGLLPNFNDAHIVPDNQLFLAGDVRANENIELAAVQTLLVREHNLVAAQIASSSPKLKDEEIYQRARKIVIGELQAITYNEFLPALLGDGALKAYTGYKSNVNAGIANEFSTAAFRIGHTIINDDVEFLDNDSNPLHEEVELAEVFFNPTLLIEQGADPILKYLATDNTQEVDTKLIGSLRNFLFGPPGAGGLDLASLNIQRGRDHGLADYNSARKAYGLAPVTTWSQITSNVDLQNKLKNLYGNVNNIDLWVGGLSEDHATDSSMGPLFRKIIADQFERTRDGDRFWYERVFSGDQLAAIKSTHLSDIIKRNTWITNLQDNVFFFTGEEEAALSTLTRQSSAQKSTLAVTEKKNIADRTRKFFSRLFSFFQNDTRSYDGSGNNILHASWGKVGEALVRLAPAAYADGVSAPAGNNRPSPRLISNTLADQADQNMRNSRRMADWVYAWGQFIDHDLDLTTQGTDALDISVPKGDVYFDPTSSGTAVIPFYRSNFDPGKTQWVNKKYDNPKRKTFESLQ